MSTHVHLAVLSSALPKFVNILRIRYAKYFNNRYFRSGQLGESGFFFQPLAGKYHICTAISYILRNGLHHGVSATPFSYPFSSINYLFVRDLQNQHQSFEVLRNRKEIASRLPRRSKFQFPDEYVMDSHGYFLRDSFEEIQMVESYYVTPRAFLYNMNRLSGEEWASEQGKDGINSEAVTLDSIEVAYPVSDRLQMFKAETGHCFNACSKDDFELCQIVDNQYLSLYKKNSVYQLDSTQKRFVYNEMHRLFGTGKSQSGRILAISPEELF